MADPSNDPISDTLYDRLLGKQAGLGGMSSYMGTGSPPTNTPPGNTPTVDFPGPWNNNNGAGPNPVVPGSPAAGDTAAPPIQGSIGGTSPVRALPGTPFPGPVGPTVPLSGNNTGIIASNVAALRRLGFSQPEAVRVALLRAQGQ